jgi:hypothetical protein
MSYISSSCTEKHSFNLNKQWVWKTITKAGISFFYSDKKKDFHKLSKIFVGSEE